MPSKKTTPRARQVRLLIFALLAIVFLSFVIFKFGSMRFEFSGLQLILLQFGMFSLAVFLMVWKIILPLSRQVGKKNMKKIFS